jgi:AraC-like DNA-binding protein
MKIIDIAYKLGYEDLSHFTRAFRHLAGLSPREYRSQHQLNEDCVVAHESSSRILESVPR